ncbi:hypothetical protein [Halorubrum sp. C191]|uniref:hypothetical protein n=1 Tax=Halorubrum sp. C191 TaxID=1383842 RepID=UPI0013042840|nr:hypothetical protein [Halorubrum sp. C191]
MNEIEALLLGFALGSIPSLESARIMVATLGKRLGVKPAEIQEYNSTTNDPDDG